jgi:8-oxo-dGTP diphosphatase
MTERRSGDGFLRCSDGHVRWGVFGAAGVVFVVAHHGESAEPMVMIQQRSQWSHEGGTWSCPGGAMDEGETALETALREATEEIGPVPHDHRVIGEYVFAPADDWTYTTAVIQVDAPFGEPQNFETDVVGWAPLHVVETLPLHPGFAAAWPHVRAIIDESLRSGGFPPDPRRT